MAKHVLKWLKIGSSGKKSALLLTFKKNINIGWICVNILSWVQYLRPGWLAFVGSHVLVLVCFISFI